MPARAKTYVGCVIAAGSLATYQALAHWECADPWRFAIYLLLGLVAGTLKVRLPGITGTYSLNFLFVLISIGELTLPETIAIACSAMIVQCTWRTTQRPHPSQVIFNIAATALSVVTSLDAAQAVQTSSGALVAQVLAAAVVYFITNTLLVSGVLALVEEKSFKRVWSDWFYWSSGFYAAGVATALAAVLTSHYFGWLFSLLVIPVMYLEYLCLNLSVRGQRNPARS